MSELGTVRTVNLNDVTFYEPDADIRRQIRQYHRKKHLSCAIIFTALFVLFCVLGLIPRFDKITMWGIVRQRIDFNYCGRNPEGMTVMLVHDEHDKYSVYPLDRPFQ